MSFPSTKPDPSPAGQTSQYVQGRIAWADQQNALLLGQWKNGSLLKPPSKILVDTTNGIYTEGSFAPDELARPKPPVIPGGPTDMGNFHTSDAAGEILSAIQKVQDTLDRTNARLDILLGSPKADAK